MTADQFKAWMAQMRYDDNQAAAALGVHANTIRNYKRGERDSGSRPVEIPRYVSLACEHLALLRS